MVLAGLRKLFRLLRCRLLNVCVLLPLVSLWNRALDVSLFVTTTEQNALDGDAFTLSPFYFENFTVASSDNHMVKVFPRQFFLETTNITRNHARRRTIHYPMSRATTYHNETGLEYREFEREWFTECEPTERIEIRPTCNSIHELDSFEGPEVTLLSMEGSWRCVWKADDYKSEEAMILKMLQMNREFDSESFGGHEMDIRVMERMTSSPHVVNAFQFCGQSVLTEFARSSAKDVWKDQNMTWKERLDLGGGIARGLADLHALQSMDFDHILSNVLQKDDPIAALKSLSLEEYPPIFAHHDINIANVISLAPKQVHWNDFNLGILSRIHIDGSGACPIPIRYEGIMWRSPEEIANNTGTVSTLQPSDVHSLGTLLYTVLTKHQPWKHLEETPLTEEELANKKINGDLPALPSKYIPARIEAKVLWAATRACFRKDPRDRPTALHLATSLGLALHYIKKRIDLSDEMIEDIFA